MADDTKQPSREFLSTLIILLRKCESETGMDLTHFFEKFEEEYDVDLYDDKALRSAVHKYMDKLYPPDEQPKFNPEDFIEDDEQDELPEDAIEEDEGPLPTVAKMEDQE